MTSRRGFALLVLAALLASTAAAPAATPRALPAALVPVDTAGSGSSRGDSPLDGALEAPRVSELAPDFELPAMDGNGTMRLSQFRGSRPVMLVFGSYT